MSNPDFLKIESLIKAKGNWIPKSEVWQILDFSRLDNFNRFLKNPKYDYGILYSEITETPKSISIRLFFDLANQRLTWNNEWEIFFSNIWKYIFSEKIIRFTASNTRSCERHDLWNLKVSGKFYTYSLTTRNIANDNDFCLFEVYKFCVQNFLDYRDTGKCVVDYYSGEPYVTFDSKNHTQRFLIMVFLKKMADQYPMDSLQKKRFLIYCKVMENMLLLQYEVDCKREEQERRRQERIDKEIFGEVITESELTEIKKLYRKIAFLSHPDTSENDGKIFHEATEAYNKKNVIRLQSIYNKLLR